MLEFDVKLNEKGTYYYRKYKSAQCEQTSIDHFACLHKNNLKIFESKNSECESLRQHWIAQCSPAERQMDMRRDFLDNFDLELRGKYNY